MARARLVPEPAGQGAQVIRRLVTDSGAGPAGRWRGLTMDNRVRADYEHSLSNPAAPVEGWAPRLPEPR
jgi:hypothetical protein